MCPFFVRECELQGMPVYVSSGTDFIRPSWEPAILSRYLCCCSMTDETMLPIVYIILNNEVHFRQ